MKEKSTPIDAVVLAANALEEAHRELKKIIDRTGPMIDMVYVKSAFSAINVARVALEASSTHSTKADVEALKQIRNDLQEARMYLSNGAGCYEMSDINYSFADHVRTLKNAIKAFDKGMRDLGDEILKLKAINSKESSE